MVGDLLGHAPAKLGEGRRVEGQVAIAAAAAHGHGAQVLGAHHGAHAGPPVVVAELVHDHRVAHPVLPGAPDLQRSGQPIADLLADRGLDRRRILAPQVPRIADLCRAVLHPEVHGIGRLPGDDDGVEARHLELRAPVAAGLRLAEPVGEGRAGDGVEAGRRRDGSAGEQPRRQDQDVLRAQRIAAGAELPQEVVRRERLAARVAPVEGLVEGLGGDRPAGEVDAQDRPVGAVAHR